jgi:cyanophycin synthetase
MGGKIPFQVQNALAATAAAWGAGLNPAMIVRALTTFTTDINMVPGRFNVTELNGVQVILDYGHNPAAILALGEAVKTLGQRHTVMAFTLPGDRRDEDLIATLEATFPFVDEYVLQEQKDLRGRTHMEVPRLFQKHLPRDIPYEFAENQRDGIFKAWKRVKPGDRLILIADVVDDTLEIFRELAVPISEDAACSSPLHSEFSQVH